MKKTLLFLTAATLLAQLSLSKAQAADISVDVFYDQLGDYGDWVEAGDYGYAWQPRDVEEDWQPYSDGRWAYTDAGWTWVSDEPYGWAVYHYGRWTRLEERGWVWVPGTEWAPAWVSWRRSPRHVGWAPLPPEAKFRRDVGLSTWVDSYYDIGPANYRFVEARNFGAPKLRTVFVQPSENITIIRETTNITKITYVNNEVYNGGPQYDEISRESTEPVRRLRLDRRMHFEGDPRAERGDRLRTQVESDSLRIFSPIFTTQAVAAPPPKVTTRIQKVQVNHGWANAGPAAEVEKLRQKVRSEAPVPAGLPPQPRFEKLTAETVSSNSEPGVSSRAAAPDANPNAAAAGSEPAAMPGLRGDKRASKGNSRRERGKPDAAAPTPSAEDPASTPRETAPSKPGKMQGGRKSPAASESSSDSTPTPDAGTREGRSKKRGLPESSSAADSTPAESKSGESSGAAQPRMRGDRRRAPNDATDASEKSTPVPRSDRESDSPANSPNSRPSPSENAPSERPQRAPKANRDSAPEPGSASGERANPRGPRTSPGKAGADSAPKAAQPAAEDKAGKPKKNDKGKDKDPEQAGAGAAQ